MKTKLNLAVLAALLLTSATITAAEMYRHKFTELQIKDYDEMLQMVDDKIAQSKAAAIKAQEEGLEEEGDKLAVEKLREALTVVLSRPDKDNMVAKLFPGLKKELSNYQAFEGTMGSIVSQALFAVQNENLSLSSRSTAVFILENTLSEIKPLLSSNEGLMPSVKRIRDANLKISDKVKSHRKLTSMDSTPDLSKIAGKIYEEAEKQIAAKKKEKKAAPQTETESDEE